MLFRSVGTSTRVAVASPAYLATRGEPQTPMDLVAHNCLVYSNPIIGPRWSYQSTQGQETISVSGSFASNSAEVIREACLCGLGIALMPDWLFREDLASGRLRRILLAVPADGLPMYVIYGSRKFLPSKMRVVIDFLLEVLGQDFAADAPAKRSTISVK